MKVTKEMQSHFLNLYAFALSDTEVDTNELEFLYKFGESRGINNSQIDALLLKPDKVKFTIPEDILDKIEYLYDFAQMIWADGVIDEFERENLKKFCYKFGFKETHINELADFLLEEAKNGTDKMIVIKQVNETIEG